MNSIMMINKLLITAAILSLSIVTAQDAGA